MNQINQKSIHIYLHESSGLLEDLYILLRLLDNIYKVEYTVVNESQISKYNKRHKCDINIFY